jgi:hypothetical protein
MKKSLKKKRQDSKFQRRMKETQEILGKVET